MLWLLTGLAVGVLGTLLAVWLQKSGVKLRWHEWLLVGLGAFLILFNIDTFVNSLAELESKAANLSLLFLGLPGLVLLVLGIRLAYSRKSAQAKASVSKAS